MGDWEHVKEAFTFSAISGPIRALGILAPSHGNVHQLPRILKIILANTFVGFIANFKRPDETNYMMRDYKC